VEVGKNKRLKWCAKPDCGKEIVKPPFCKCSNRVVCERGHETCFKCAREWHDGKCKVDEGEAAFKIYGLLNAVAKCPTCSAPSEKIEGCNKMTCYRCQGHWCWVCRQKINGYDHFESLFGGCFGGGVSCGGCYLGILLAQLIILALSPFIVYFVVLYEAIKKFSLWQLLEPILKFDLIP
jgi:hypothetical protein